MTIPESATSIGGAAFFNCNMLVSVAIPLSVTSIGSSAFYGCRSLTSVTIPEGVASIGDSAFNSCSGLTSVTIPEGVTSIGNSAFSGCSSLISITVDENNAKYSNDERGVLFNKEKTTLIQYPIGNMATSYEIPEGVTSIGGYAFRGCSRLMSVTIPKSVTGIGHEAFYSCSSLASMTIPSSVTSIGWQAFYACSGLTSVTIPESVTSIGYQAFSICSSLTNIAVDANNAKYSSDECGVLFDKNKTILIQYPIGSKFASYEIPSSVTSIGETAFYWCDRLMMVTIPMSMISIGDYAFSGCNSLKDVYYPGTEESWIKIDIDSGNTSLIDATIHYSSSFISGTCGDGSNGSNVTWAFDNEGTLRIVGEGQMRDCSNTAPWYSFRSSIKRVIIDEGVTSIGKYAFVNCSSFTSVTIPPSVTSIGDGAFADCGSLMSVTIPSSVTSIGWQAFSKCSSLISVTIPEGVTSIGDHAFNSCRSLTSVNIPASVTSIGNYVFSDCSSLTSITVDENNAKYSSDERGVLFNKEKTTLIQCPIGNTATSYEIPSSVTSIGNSAFEDCSSLTSVTIPESVMSIYGDAFSSCRNLKSVYITNLEAWCTIKFYNSASNPLYYGADLYINGERATNIVIPLGVTRINDYTFYNYKSLMSICFPVGMLCINRPGFESVTYSADVTSIGNYAFYGCSNLALVTIPAGVTNIGEVAFGGCSSLTSITVDVNNAKYSNDERGVLLNKDKTTLIQYPIGNTATSYEIPSSVTSIGSRAFYNCSLTSVTIPESVTSIKDWAFSGCTNLKDVYYPGTEEEWKKISIGSYNTKLTTATIHYKATVLTPSVTRTADGVVYKVSAANLLVSSVVVVALYKDGRFVGYECAVYNGETLEIAADTPHDSATILAWSNLEKLIPLVPGTKIGS